MEDADRNRSVIDRPSVNRLFFALWPDAATREACASAARKLRGRLQAGGHFTDPQRFHVTLLFLGDAVPIAQEGAALQAASLLRAAPFALRLDQAGSFRNRHIPWWLGPRETPPELNALHDNLRIALRNANVAYDRMRFAPHLTILRDAARPLPATPIEPIEWRVQEFVLVKSLLHATPVEYRILGRWPLDGALSTASQPAQINLWEN